MWPVPLTPLTAAVREFFQPPPRSGGLVLHADGLPHRPLLSSLFPSECLSPFAQVQVFT